jgi:predicted nucleic acid-binding protein
MMRHRLSETRAGAALEDYLDLPLTRCGHKALLPRIVELRANFTAYDACYVALAEQLRGELLTADEPLARAVSQRTHVGVVA